MAFHTVCDVCTAGQGIKEPGRIELAVGDRTYHLLAASEESGAKWIAAMIDWVAYANEQNKTSL